VNVLLAGLASCSWLTRASTDCSSKPGPVLIRCSTSDHPAKLCRTVRLRRCPKT
jgi:hypothetical protein